MSFRFRDDQVFSSGSGKYELDARCPLNGKVEDPSPDGSKEFDWCFRFYEKGARPSLLWERWFSRREMEPTEAWISEKGAIVIDSTGPFFSDLIVLDKLGEERLRIRMAPESDSFDGDFRSKYIRVSTAATHWNYGALEGLFVIDGSEYFFLDFLWGDSIVLELENHLWLKNAEVERLLPKLEGARAEECARRLQSTDDFEVLSALCTISRHPNSSMVPRLRHLEKTEETTHSPGGSSLDHKTYKYIQSQHGGFLKLAMRRCGQLPEGSPCFTFQSDIPVDVPRTEPNRDRLWKHPNSTTTWRETLLRFGAPDAISWHAEEQEKRFRGAEVWEYYLGLGDDISVAKFFWEPGSDGEFLRDFEILPLDVASIGDHLVYRWTKCA